MADEADLADAQIERTLQGALLKAKSARGLVPIGHCHFCEEPIASGLFCPPVDASGDGCARDYDRQARMTSITLGA